MCETNPYIVIDDEEDEEEDLIEDEETNQVEDPTSTEPRETNLFAGLTLIYLIEEGLSFSFSLSLS